MIPKSSKNDPKVIPKWPLSNPPSDPSDIHDMHVMHVMHAFHACHARMSRISRPCAQFRPCSPCSIRPLETHFRCYFRALGEGSVPIGGNSFELSASSSRLIRTASTSVFEACGVVLGEIRAQSCKKKATSVPPAQSVRGRCPF